jgi:3-oxoacyl-[acyl-carrier-protein] synthase-3
MEATLENVRIAGISAAVPRGVQAIADSSYEDPAARQRFSTVTGIQQRRLCRHDQFFSDLALAAAERLLEDLRWDRSSIDALVVVTQSGDLAYPATACVLQHKLGLSTACAAFDINLGCSGYPYALYTAGRLLRPMDGSRVLVLVGDAAGKLNPASPRPPLFGDAATATALEWSPEAEPIEFSLHTDGSGWHCIMERRPGGNPPVESSRFHTVTDENGHVHLGFHNQLLGEDVVNFSTRIAPAAVRDLLSRTGRSTDDADFFVFHQANRLINESIRRTLRLDPAKVPSTLADFGNTSSATIPLTLVEQCGSILREKPSRFVLCGFGVGLSWGTTLCQLGPISCPPLVEI